MKTESVQSDAGPVRVAMRNNMKTIVIDGVRHRHCIYPTCEHQGKLLSEKFFSKTPVGYLLSYCRECKKKANSLITQKRDYRRRMGVGPEVYEALLKKQGGKCAICGSAEPGGNFRFKKRKYLRFSLDHCHVTGRIRGLLCAPCNRGLGSFLDNPDVMRVAAEYLERKDA